MVAKGSERVGVIVMLPMLFSTVTVYPREFLLNGGARVPGETAKFSKKLSPARLARLTRTVYDFDVPPVPVSVTTMLTDCSAPGELRVMV